MRKEATEGVPGPARQGASLGPLETAVMECVWDRGGATVRDVYRALLAGRKIAYTTVMTTMSNLATKGVLRRHLNGRAYVYVPTVSRDQYERSVIARLVDALVSRATAPAMTYLVDRMVHADPETLAVLERAIADVRRGERGGGEAPRA